MTIISANYRLRRLALYQRAGTYGVRIVVPKSLRSVIGKTELKKSLGTKDLNRAKLLGPPIEDKFRAIINAAKEGVKLSPKISSADVTPNQLNLITGKFYRRLLQEFEDSYDGRHFNAGDVLEAYGLPCCDNGKGVQTFREERFDAIAEEETKLHKEKIDISELSYRFEKAFERAVKTLESRAQGLKDP